MSNTWKATDMSHGFGMSIKELKADELRHAAADKGYDSQYRDGTVNIADVTGLTVAVRIVDGKYCMKGKRHDIYFAEANSVMKRIPKAFEIMKTNLNKNY